MILISTLTKSYNVQNVEDIFSYSRNGQILVEGTEKDQMKFAPDDDGVAAEGVVAGLGSSIVRRLAVSFRQF